MSFCGVLDYLFTSREHFQLQRVLGPVEHAWFINNQQAGMPNAKMPSDHLPVVADYRFLMHGESDDGLA